MIKKVVKIDKLCGQIHIGLFRKFSLSKKLLIFNEMNLQTPFYLILYAFLDYISAIGGLKSMIYGYWDINKWL